MLTAAAHAFYTELFFYFATTSALLWLPFYFGRKLKIKPLTRRNLIALSLLCAFTLLMMNIECLPRLISSFHKFQGVLP